MTHIDGTPADVRPGEAPVHLVRDGYGTTRCCYRSPFELPSDERMTDDPDAVTCGLIHAAEEDA